MVFTNRDHLHKKQVKISLNNKEQCFALLFLFKDIFI